MKQKTKGRKQFEKDNKEATKAELLVRDVLASLTDDYSFTHVGKQPEYFYRGDIKADDGWFDDILLEVKNDGVIYRTGNVLCEYKVFYKEDGYYGKGNMKSNYDYYLVHSAQDKIIYVFDFEVLQSIYRQGKHHVQEHETQITYAYLVNLDKIDRAGGWLYTIHYDLDESGKAYGTKAYNFIN